MNLSIQYNTSLMSLFNKNARIQCFTKICIDGVRLSFFFSTVPNTFMSDNELVQVDFWAPKPDYCSFI